MNARNSIRFVLNDEDVALRDIPATQTLLDYLRLEKELKGSKEGCAEGDCGACTVLVGRLRNGELVYETVTACITFTASLNATHVVTIEHLSAANGALHPVQQAMVDFHGSQCGFCTPGIVMSLYGLWMRKPEPTVPEIETALQGNLCRCTGYTPIVRAGQAISTYGAVASDPLVAERAVITARLQALADGKRVEVGEGRNRIIIPASVDDLAEVYAAEPEATIVAGSTDVGLWVTKFMREIGPLIFVGHLDELRTIEASQGGIKLGAGVSYTDAAPAITQYFPQLEGFWNRIGGEQVRNMGTVGGNIANGSPIGDTPPPLIVLGAHVILRKGNVRRELKLRDYFIAYGKQDREPGEFVESITIPALPDGEHFAAYKISKRRDEDIAALCGAFRVFVNDLGNVGMARIAFGGMAATPKRATNVEEALIGRPWTMDTVEEAVQAFAQDYQPITDMRASADYRLLAAQNLLRRFFLEATGQGERLERGAA
ncbi:xanthine dehydrogenase small subunit [Paradevosia shaoguanensis]|uniref:xanthine dehydrogenase small subunit n=1 Tax=Paradevosia shaoguanensis TaxID=1335043 RepID=UPI003C73E6C5